MLLIWSCEVLPFFEKNVVSEEVLAPFSNRGPSENSLPTLMTTQCLVAFKLLPFSKGGLSSYDAIDIKKVGMSCYGTKSTCLLFHRGPLIWMHYCSFHHSMHTCYLALALLKRRPQLLKCNWYQKGRHVMLWNKKYLPSLLQGMVWKGVWHLSWPFNTYRLIRQGILFK